VLVTIQNGDWTQQKTIISRKKTDSTEPLEYISPISQVANLTGNINQRLEEVGIAANSPIEKI
jgi:hypothetical protein